MIRPPPNSTLFPYTPLSRSDIVLDLPIRLIPDPDRPQAAVAGEGIDFPLVGDRVSGDPVGGLQDRKSTRLNSSHSQISYAVFCLKKKKTKRAPARTIAIAAS